MSILYWVEVGAGSTGPTRRPSVLAPDSSVGARTYIRCVCFVLQAFARYLSCMSLVTDFTPLTALATRTALLISERELTQPLN
jgi:hypothetical protein